MFKLAYENGIKEGKRIALEGAMEVDVHHFATQPHYRHAWPDKWTFPVGETRRFVLVSLPEVEAIGGGE